MEILRKIRVQGFQWLLRRIAAELIMPKTKLGCKFQWVSKLAYYGLSKPIQYLSFRRQIESKDLDTLYFFYDFEVEPITFDFVWALAIAEAERKSLNLCRIKILLVPGTQEGLRIESSDYEHIVSKDARYWRIHAIIFPIVQLLASNYSLYFCSSREEAALIKYHRVGYQYPQRYSVEIPISYNPRDIMRYKSDDVLYIHAGMQALRYIQQWKQQQCGGEKRLIVITLRNYGFGLDRNSNLPAWLQFARSLNSEAYKVVFIPDNEDALLQVETQSREFEYFSAACWNVALRAALYESAYLNLGVNTGPMALCWFSPKCRYITFKTITPSVPQATKEVMESRGFVEFENPKFAKIYQKWSWLNDDYDNIQQEFVAMLPLLEQI